MHAPVSTFEHRGKQYLIAFSAGSALLGSARGDSVWLFGLDGTLPPAAPGTAVPRSTAVPAPANGVPATRVDAAGPTPAVAAANISRGKQIYEQACLLCHGADGTGGHGVGAPLVSVRDVALAMQTVADGRNAMPSFKTSFAPDQIRDVSAYVVQAFATAAGR
jgi:mono/diheme cytochrome c family protein